MQKEITPTEFRKNLFGILKELEKTGQSIRIVAQTGSRFELIPHGKPSKFDKIPRKNNVINGNPDDIVHMDWSGEIHLDLP